MKFCEKHIQFILYGEGKQYYGLLKIVEQLNYRTQLITIQQNKILFYDDNDITAGGSLYAGIFEGVNNQNLKELLVLDTLPYNIGVEIADSKMSVMIPKDYAIPAVKRQTYTTFTDYQVEINLKVFEGLSEEIKDCQFIGNQPIKQIRPDLKGKPQINIEFLVNESGFLSISYCETTNDTKQVYSKKHALVNSNPLYQDEATIEKLQKQVEKDQLNCRSILYNHIEILKPKLSDEDAQQMENLINKINNNERKYEELLSFYQLLNEKSEKMVKK